jgi:hypothetical protein
MGSYLKSHEIYLTPANSLGCTYVACLLASTDVIENEDWNSWDHYDEKFDLMESRRFHISFNK